jgi:hypothetical protein
MKKHAKKWLKLMRVGAAMSYFMIVSKLVHKLNEYEKQVLEDPACGPRIVESMAACLIILTELCAHEYENDGVFVNGELFGLTKANTKVTVQAMRLRQLRAAAKA